MQGWPAVLQTLGSGLLLLLLLLACCCARPGYAPAGFGEIRSGAGTAHLWEKMGSGAMEGPLLWSSSSSSSSRGGAGSGFESSAAVFMFKIGWCVLGEFVRGQPGISAIISLGARVLTRGWACADGGRRGPGMADGQRAKKRREARVIWESGECHPEGEGGWERGAIKVHGRGEGKLSFQPRAAACATMGAVQSAHAPIGRNTRSIRELKLNSVSAALCVGCVAWWPQRSAAPASTRANRYPFPHCAAEESHGGLFLRLLRL